MTLPFTGTLHVRRAERGGLLVTIDEALNVSIAFTDDEDFRLWINGGLPAIPEAEVSEEPTRMPRIATEREPTNVVERRGLFGRGKGS